MRVCLVYDCLYPYTIGGAERWYRNLALRLTEAGHEVTYLTLRQWDRGAYIDLPGVRVVAVGPRMALYSGPGQRRILPPVVFGLGVLWHLLLHGRRYEVVHTSSFPYFSLLAAALARPLAGYRVATDWFEVWSRAYWRDYLGAIGGTVGWLIQRVCARVPQRAFCFSRLHAERLAHEGRGLRITILSGLYDGDPPPDELVINAETTVVFAGRHIPEKRAPLVVDTIDEIRRRGHELDGLILGDGPELQRVRTRISELGLDDVVSAPGFVSVEQLDAALARAACLLLPSEREGYGMVVIEAARVGTPCVLAAAPDNAAVELIESGVNGYVAASADARELADAVITVLDGGTAMRRRTADWFAARAEMLSLAGSLDEVVGTYGFATSR